MTKKDMTTQENIDQEKDAKTAEENKAGANEQPGTATGKTHVKNASAAGDGAFGRSETSIPEETEQGENEAEAPAY